MTGRGTLNDVLFACPKCQAMLDFDYDWHRPAVPCAAAETRGAAAARDSHLQFSRSS